MTQPHTCPDCGTPQCTAIRRPCPHCGGAPCYPDCPAALWQQLERIAALREAQPAAVYTPCSNVIPGLPEQAARLPRPRHTAAVREVKLVPVATIPDTSTYNDADRAAAVRVLSHQMAELMSLYGAGIVLKAAALALGADMRQAAWTIHAEELAAAYAGAAFVLQETAANLDAAEEATRAR